MPWPRLTLSFVWFYDMLNWPPKLCTKFEVDTISHCINIKGKTPNFGSSPSPGPRFSFSPGWYSMIGFGKPHQPANFEVATFSHCRNIKGKPQILGSSASPGPRAFPLGVILWWDLANLSCIPNLKSLASAVAKILKGNRIILGSYPRQGHAHFFCVWFMMGLGKPKLHTKPEVASFRLCRNIKGQPPKF